MLGAIFTVLGGHLNPHFSSYPSLFIYMAAIAHFVASGFSSSGNSVWALSHDILIHARFVSALLGALTIPVVFALGREIGGAKIGLLAALFLCFAPAHVQHSHFATVDAAATFWVALSLLLATRALNFTSNATSANEDSSKGNNSRKVVRLLLMSALCAGLGAATKYNAVIVLIAPLAACFFIEYSKRTTSGGTNANEKAKNAADKSELPQRIGLALGIFATAVFGFLVGCPMSVLRFREWWGDGKYVGVKYELLVHPRLGHGDIFKNTGNGWLYHATFNLPFALTAPLAIAALLGLLLVLEGMTKSRKSGIGSYRVLVPILSFALFYFFTLGFSQVRFLRYTLPLLPALTIFAALFVRAVVAALRTRGEVAKIALSAAFLLIPIVGTFNVLWPLTQTDSRDAAKNWLDNQKEAAPISVGLADARFPLWFYTPPFWPQDAPPGSPLSWQNVTRNPRYDLQAIGLDAAALQEKRPRYFAWSEFQWREGERLNDANVASLRRQLGIEYSMRAFHNEPPLQLPGRDFVPHDFLYTNPRVEVWRRKKDEG